MILTKDQVERFSEINDKIRAEEIRARAHLITLRENLLQQVTAGIIDDFEIEIKYDVYSDDEEFCAKKNVEIGNPFFEDHLYFSLFHDCEEEFNLNWFIQRPLYKNDLAHLHFGHLMHCLLDVNCMDIEDVLKIDIVWIDIHVMYQFTTKKTF